MSFKATICHPLKKDILQLGEMKSDQIVEVFEKTAWAEYLRISDEATKNNGKIYYSPSFGVENVETRIGIEVTAIGIPDEFEWWIFFKRPKERKLFGLIKFNQQNYLSEVHGQKKSDVLDCMKALFRDDLFFLEDKMIKDKVIG